MYINIFKYIQRKDLYVTENVIKAKNNICKLLGPLVCNKTQSGISPL